MAHSRSTSSRLGPSALIQRERQSKSHAIIIHVTWRNKRCETLRMADRILGYTISLMIAAPTSDCRPDLDPRFCGLPDICRAEEPLKRRPAVHALSAAETCLAAYIVAG